MVPNLYKITQKEFDGYIKRLEKAGLLERRFEDEICYYDATPAAYYYNKKDFVKLIESATFGISRGVTTAILEQ